MARPPRCVVLVARTHWIIGGVMVLAIAVLAALVRNIHVVEFGAKTYLITGALAAMYLLAGTLVWLGAPGGRILSRVCTLLYLARPQLGSAIWHTMDEEEFRAHFR